MKVEGNELLLWTYNTILNYLEKLNDPLQKINKNIPIQELSDKLNLTLPREVANSGEAYTNFTESMQTFLDYSVLSGHRHFYNQLYGELEVSALAAEFLSILNNSSMATYQMSPVATLMERKIIERFAQMIWSHTPSFSSDSADGLLVLGGSYANMMAILCARNYLFPKFKDYGYSSVKNQLKIFVSEEAHYSFMRAANTLGIGHKNVVIVESDHLGKMKIEQLEKNIVKSIEDGDKPFFVAATFGTTVTGSIDSFQEIYEVANKYGLWFHIDGAFLGPLLLDPSRFFVDEVATALTAVTAGIEFADSFSLDAHKMMGVPLTCSAILFKRGETLRESICGGEGDYLFHLHQDDHQDDHLNATDIGKYSLQCGRKIDCLKLWGLWQYLGDEGILKRFENLFKLIKYAEEIIKQNSEDLELVLPRQSLILLFRYCRGLDKINKINDINYSIHQKIISRGDFMVNYAIWKGKLSLRLVILNQNASKEDLDNFFHLIMSIGKEVS
ncbi:MAG: aminotransferase class V-fold PLP-dependent enzyme [Oligoflexia bacterium]|nr:aminotransferase class V-fold PLP-dependent enzyme [Oligoflexia bacterium]